MNYYISDLHLFCKGHIKNGRFDNRPFETLEEMHNVIKSNWNNKITNADHVYILGDISKRGYSDDLTAFMSQLKGNKHLILGNHDDVNDLRFKQLFSEVCNYKEMSDAIDGKSYRVVLSHFPIMMWHGQHKGDILLYGHVHNTREEGIFQDFVKQFNDMNREEDKEMVAYNVGCMRSYMNYTPKTLKEIINNRDNGVV